jgi:membrane-bound inhibitor of C-type lysozyme
VALVLTRSATIHAENREFAMSQHSPWWERGAALAFLGVVLAGCAQPQTYPGRDFYRYQCEGGKSFDVTIAPDKNSAVVKFDDQEWTLKRTISASGANFSDGAKVLWMKENKALIEVNSEVLFRKCTSVASPP